MAGFNSKLISDGKEMTICEKRKMCMCDVDGPCFSTKSQPLQVSKTKFLDQENAVKPKFSESKKHQVIASNNFETEFTDPNDFMNSETVEYKILETDAFKKEDWESNDFESNNWESNDFESNELESSHIESNDWESNDFESNNLEEDEEEEYEFSCVVCEIGFETESELGDHFESVHESKSHVESPNENEVGETRFIDYELGDHYESVYVSENRVESSNEDLKPHISEICSKSVLQKEYLTEHNIGNTIKLENDDQKTDQLLEKSKKSEQKLRKKRPKKSTTSQEETNVKQGNQILKSLIICFYINV